MAVIFCGRLADYKYYDMHVTVERALDVVKKRTREHLRTSQIKGGEKVKYYLKDSFLHNAHEKNAGVRHEMTWKLF